MAATAKIIPDIYKDEGNVAATIQMGNSPKYGKKIFLNIFNKWIIHLFICP